MNFGPSHGKGQGLGRVCKCLFRRRWASAQLARPGDTEHPFEWDEHRALIVAARCPRCQSCYTDVANNTERNQLDAFGVTVRFELLWLDDGGMRMMQRNPIRALDLRAVREFSEGEL